VAVAGLIQVDLPLVVAVALFSWRMDFCGCRFSAAVSRDFQPASANGLIQSVNPSTHQPINPPIHSSPMSTVAQQWLANSRAVMDRIEQTQIPNIRPAGHDADKSKRALPRV
jgi:hypothetical protein